MSSAVPDESPRKLELSPVQVAASALAAMSAAFFASWAGTAGTLIGAAVGSIIATVGAATYSYSLNRTRELAKRTASQVREGALTRPARVGETQRLEVVPADADTDEDEAVTGWRRFDPRHAQLPWGKVALASAAVLLVVMVAITSFEGLTGRSVADVTRGSDSGNTTLGNLVGNDSGRQAPTDDVERPGDDGRPGQTEAPGTDESTDPTPAPDPTEEASEEPTEEPSGGGEPSPTPTPTPTPTADSQGEPTATPSA